MNGEIIQEAAAPAPWLLDFAYKITVQWWVFVVAGGLTLLIAFVTMSFTTVKSSLANPVDSLRSE